MTKQTAEIFAKNLNRYMKLYKMNQSDVAKLTGSTHQVVSRWCSGKTLPRMGKIQILADHFMTEYIVDCEVKSEEKAKSKKRSESAIRKEMDRLNDMYLKGRISVEIYDSKYEQLEDELKDSSQSKIKPSDAVLGLQGVNLQELYGTFSDDEKSAFWHGLIKEIRIDDSFNIVDIIFND